MSKELLKVVPTLHAAILVGNLAKKKKKKKLARTAIEVMLGTTFIKAESNIIAGM